MKQILSDHDRTQLNERITETEKQTDTQIVLAVIKRSDSYAELPWKAFALGASLAGLSFFILSLLLNYPISQITVLIAIAATLLAGVIFALLTVFVPVFAKIFLSAHRAEEEVRQYAESLFLEKELFATGKRKGILLLISLFESKVIIIPDRGISNRLTGEKMEQIMAPMIVLLRRNDVSKAFENGLKQLSSILGTIGSSDKYENELQNNIIEEKGL